MVRVSALLAVFGFSLVGCQSYQTGMLTLCEAPKSCQACQGAAPEDQSRLMAEHIERSVRNSEAAAVAKSMENLSARDRVTVLRKTAEEAGVAGCKLADIWEAELANIPEPIDPPPSD